MSRRSQDSRQQERQVSKNAKMVRHRWIFPRPRRRRVSVLAYRKGQGCQVQGRFDDQKEEFSLSTRVETCCSGRETKKKRRGGRRREKKEEGKRRRRRRRRGERGRGVFIFIVAPRLQVHLFVASSRTNKPTNSSFAFTCSFTSWQRCVVAMVAMVAKPIKVQGSVQHPHMVPEEKKLQPSLAIEPTASTRFFSAASRVRMDRDETTNSDELRFQASYRKPRWHGRSWSWATFFIIVPWVKKKVDLVRRKSILYTGRSREFSVGQSRDKSFKSRGTGGGGRMMVDRSFSFNEFLLVFAPFTSSTLLY